MPFDPAQAADQLREAANAYYLGKPTLSDDEFDRLKDKLAKNDPDNAFLAEVGAPVGKHLAKVKHQALCGSLNNTFEAEGITAWVAKMEGLSQSVVIEDKLDGLSLAVTYKGGKMVRAATRGDGTEGEDVTANARKMATIPKQITPSFNGEIRGEVVILKQDFDTHFKPRGDANPRNSAAGTMRKADSPLAKHLVFFAYAQVSDNSVIDNRTEVAMMKSLHQMGFTIAQWVKVPLDIAFIVAKWLEYGREKESKPYCVDGMVVKLNSRESVERLGVQDGCPRGHLACKWRNSMVAETTVVGIENQVGRTGRITPVAILKPVACGGVTVSRVTLKNWDEVKRLEDASKMKMGLGSTISLQRGGDVIPDITALVGTAHTAFSRPESCPSCSAETFESGPFQVCGNPACPAQTFRTILNWIKGRNILHLGESTLDALMALDGPVATIADLYKVSEQRIAKCIKSAVTAEKIVAQIEKSRECYLHQVVGNIGIPGIGVTEAESALTNMGIKRSVTKLIQACADSQDPGLGPGTSDKFIRGVLKRQDLLLELDGLLTIVKKPEATPGSGEWSGKSFCITGASAIPREALKKIIVDAGGVWKSSVTNGLDYLILNETGTTKAKAAEAKGVKTVTEQQALDMAGYK